MNIVAEIPAEFPEDIRIKLTSDLRYEILYQNHMLTVASSPQKLREVMNNLKKFNEILEKDSFFEIFPCLLYTSPSPRDRG